MISLLIDTSTKRLSVYVVDELENTIKASYSELVSNDMSTKALEVVKTLLEKISIEPKDVDKIYVANGPGSFTGVRIGVTIAKTYAWTLNKKIIPISSLEFMCSTNTESLYNIGIIDARRSYVFAGIYDKELNTYIEDNYISIEDLMAKMPSDASFISDDEFDNINIIKPNIDPLKIVLRHKNDEGVNPHHLNPVYLKITEAEANLKDKNDNRN